MEQKAESLELSVEVRDDELTRASADHLLRSLQSNHLQLSAIADQKASILVGATMVVLGVMAPIDPSDSSPALLILAVTAALAGASAVMSLIPRVRSGDGRRNVLFFGFHSRMSPEDFHQEMGEILFDGDRIYEAIVEDVYQLGQVLSRKYKFVNLAYTILVVGLSATVVALLVEAT